MPTRAEDGAFTFETTYESPDGLPKPRPVARSKFGLTEDQLFIAFAILGAVCLLWRYSIALGVFLLAMTTFVWVMRERGRAMRRHSPLVEPPTRISIRVTNAGYSQRGDDFFAESSWGRVINGLEMGGYLLGQSWRVPRVYLPIEEMKRAGVYERIKAIVDERSQLFHSARQARERS